MVQIRPPRPRNDSRRVRSAAFLLYPAKLWALGGGIVAKPENTLLLYRDEDGETNVSVLFSDEDVWLTQDQLAEVYQTTRQNIGQHIKGILRDEELPEATRKKFFRVRTEGMREVRREIEHYNLDMIIAVGYRVQSPIATRFRRWATARLHEYIQKGFALDDERLKQGGARYFRELLQRIRDIRSSERNFYQQVTDIYATSIDYDPRSLTTRNFFATVQNKLHYAVHENTAAEVIYRRVDNEKPYVGMTNFKGSYVTESDVKIAKNYLSEVELQRLNLLVSQFLDYTEFQALEQVPMKMEDWIQALDDLIVRLRRKLVKPSKGMAERFERSVLPLCEKTKRLQQEAVELSSFRDWLLPMLMNGQVIIDA